jgi:tagatose-6-phosphate ketose/aldose isomerase
MVLAGLALAYIARQEIWAEYTRTLAASARTFLPVAANCAANLSRKHCKRVFFIASRPFLGGALESQLKIQELSGGMVIAKAEDTLGLRHGFMAAIDGDSLIIFFRSGDPTRRRYENDLIDELCTKQLGKQTVIVSDTGKETSIAVQALACGTVPHDDFRSVQVTLFGQLLGLFTSLECGLKPDNPSPGGVINRVVQGVTIYLPEDSAGSESGDGNEHL